MGKLFFCICVYVFMLVEEPHGCWKVHKKSLVGGDEYYDHHHHDPLCYPQLPPIYVCADTDAEEAS